MKRLQGFSVGLLGRYRQLGIALFVGLTMSSSFAQTTSADAAFSAFDAEARGLITLWGSIAVGLCAAWVGVKLGPKFIKRLTSAV